MATSLVARTLPPQATAVLQPPSVADPNTGRFRGFGEGALLRSSPPSAPLLLLGGVIPPSFRREPPQPLVARRDGGASGNTWTGRYCRPFCLYLSGCTFTLFTGVLTC